MKYPLVTFFRHSEYSYVDLFLQENANKLECTIRIVDNINSVKSLYNVNNHLLVTFGNTKEEYDVILSDVITLDKQFSLDLRRMHYVPGVETPFDVEKFTNEVNTRFAKLSVYNRELVRPVFSAFTTTYNSYEKINRAYNSLKNQTMLDWEWVIIDDSPDEKHFEFLKKLLLSDKRVRLYRRSENNGSIGNVKNESIGLCRGKYILELDHDDEVMPFVFEESTDLFEKDPDLGFIYMDFINIYENGTNYRYGDFICKGYGSYYCIKHNNKWAYVYNTPNVNNITLSHLVCCPNHPRIWKRQTLMELGSYSEYLPICDDYEILLRTAVGTKMAKISKMGYVQYMNESNNNFSLIRNSEINRIGPQFIGPVFFDFLSIDERMKQKNAYEDNVYKWHHRKLWERDEKTYEHKYCNLLLNDSIDNQYCIIGVDAFVKNINLIKMLYNDPRNELILLSNKYNNEYLWELLDRHNLEKMKCYYLEGSNNQQLINYFNYMMKIPNKEYEIIECKREELKCCDELYNKVQVMNSLVEQTGNYLEIGIDFGISFKDVHFTKKIGVDPSPRIGNEPEEIKNKVIIKSSDDFFAELGNDDCELVEDKFFDAILIDGMHQVEYSLRDIVNSSKYLKPDGIIFLDNIIPQTYFEQLKVPIKHYYQDNILKYGEPWTGDIWKLAFYLLKDKKINENIYDIKIHNTRNERGLMSFKVNKPLDESIFDLENINSYDYFTDFDDYIQFINISYTF